MAEQINNLLPTTLTELAILMVRQAPLIAALMFLVYRQDMRIAELVQQCLLRGQ